jgi:hypothetical protein
VFAVLLALGGQAAPRPPIEFTLVQPELFSASGGQPNPWADVDGDGDLDQFVGFRGRPNRLYLNTNGTFTDVAGQVGLADNVETRAAAWGDFDGDGDPDLYVGFATADTAAKIYRNDGKARSFTDVAKQLGIELRGISRQPAWIDYDGDGDLDLFAAFRDQPNRLFRNDGARFVDVTAESGIGDRRKTVGGVWWDADADGDLDLFVANQEGDANGLFINTGGHFADAADTAGVSAAGRRADFGGVGPSVGDFDRDGDFDLFVANYGPSALYRLDAGAHFVDVAKASGITFEGHATTSVFADFDNDGWTDLYVGAFLVTEPHYRDWLFRSVGGAAGHFEEALPALLLTHDASHGLQAVDFDDDGRIDLALANNDPTRGHPLLRNVTKTAGRGLAVQVTDARGRHTKAGAEVRVYAAGTRRLLATGLVDSGSGYCSQSATPVVVGLPGDVSRVDVEVIFPARGSRAAARASGVAANAKHVIVRVP